MTINIQFGEKTVRVAVEINGAIESAMTYLPEREWVGLTDEEIDKIRNTPMSVEGGVGFSIYSYARAIEAKLKEKNATQ